MELGDWMAGRVWVNYGKGRVLTVCLQTKVKMGQTWSKSKPDLLKQLDELKAELQTLRVQKMTGSAASKLSKMYVYDNSR